MIASIRSLSRRRFFQMLVAAPIAFAVGMKLLWTGDPAHAATTTPRRAAARAPIAKPGPAGGAFTPTPECGDDDEPTPAQTEGPFYTPNSPLRTSLIEPGEAGTRIVLTGRVFSSACRPLAGALVDFWHADNDGEYDNEGFRMRGHQFTDAQGRYQLKTIIPGLYSGRTRHFHVRVQAPKGRVLTTQIYFPGEPQNQDDGLFLPELLMTLKDSKGGKAGRFHFMLDRA